MSASRPYRCVTMTARSEASATPAKADGDIVSVALVDVDVHRNRADRADRERRVHRRVGDGRNGVTRRDADGAQRDLERVGTVGDADAVPRFRSRRRMPLRRPAPRRPARRPRCGPRARRLREVRSRAVRAPAQDRSAEPASAKCWRFGSEKARVARPMVARATRGARAAAPPHLRERDPPDRLSLRLSSRSRAMRFSARSLNKAAGCRCARPRTCPVRFPSPHSRSRRQHQAHPCARGGFGDCSACSSRARSGRATSGAPRASPGR